jgi:ABC-2 type transport system permease protein
MAQALRIVPAFFARDLSIAASYRLPFILDAFYGVLQLVVYYFISRTFGNVNADDLGGAPTYFAFAAVGIIVSLVIEASTAGLAERVRSEQTTGSLEALVAQPLGALSLGVGFAAFPFAFAVVRGLIYLAVAALFMGLDLGQTDWVGVAVMFAATALALGAIGVIVGAAVIVYKRGEIAASMLIYGMTIVSGALFPVQALPPWLQAIGSVLPLRFAFDGIRDAMFRGEGWTGDALALVGFAVVALPVSIWLFGRALDAARRAGTLSQY